MVYLYYFTVASVNLSCNRGFVLVRSESGEASDERDEVNLLE